MEPGGEPAATARSTEPSATTPASPPLPRVSHRHGPGSHGGASPLAPGLILLIAFALFGTRGQVAGPPRGQPLPPERRRVRLGAAPGPLLRLQHELLQLQRAQQGGGGENLPGHG